jgi:quinol monooxygenase YgiN/catechol 2,3-dioxygenase-like lactoylglutathione lyase family enzyme
MPSDLVTVVVRIRAKEGREAEVRRELLDLLAPTRSEKGCLAYDMHEMPDEPTLFLFHETWESDRDLDRHLMEPHVQRWIEKADALLAEPMQLSRWKKLDRPAALEFHRGRMLDHVHFVVADLAASKRFYRAALGALGLALAGEGPGFFFADELFVSQAEGGEKTRAHIAFQAGDREAVQRFHQAALAAGGRDNGAPGERHYHPGYYAAFVLDPDGNNVEAVYHGPAQRSARSVVITPAA